MWSYFLLLMCWRTSLLFVLLLLFTFAPVASEIHRFRNCRIPAPPKRLLIGHATCRVGKYR